MVGLWAIIRRKWWGLVKQRLLAVSLRVFRRTCSIRSQCFHHGVHPWWYVYLYCGSVVFFWCVVWAILWTLQYAFHSGQQHTTRQSDVESWWLKNVKKMWNHLLISSRELISSEPDDLLTFKCKISIFFIVLPVLSFPVLVFTISRFSLAWKFYPSLRQKKMIKFLSSSIFYSYRKTNTASVNSFN